MTDISESAWIPSASLPLAAQAVAFGIVNNYSKMDTTFTDAQDAINDITALLDTLGSVQAIPTELGTLSSVIDAFAEPTEPTRPDIDTTYQPRPDLLDVTPREIVKGQLVGINPEFEAAPIRPNTSFNAPDEPSFAVVDTSIFPAEPTDATLGSVSSLVIDDMPELTATEPAVRDIAAPTPLARSAPTRDALPDRVMPGEPGYVLPTTKALRELTLPTAPTPLTFDFEGVLPAALDAPPSAEFAFAETPYSSTLLSQLQGTLLDLVQNVRQTGLSQAVKQQKFDALREKTDALTAGLIENIQRMYMRSGHELAAGDEAEAVFRAQEQAMIQEASDYRAIEIADAELEQKNLHMAISSVLNLEGQLIGYHNNVQQRAFDAAKYAVQAAIDLFQVKVAYFNAGVVIYEAQSRVFAERIRAEISKIELYKGQLEGQKLIGDLNRQDIDNYKAQLDGVLALFKLYETRLEAVKVQMQGDELKLRQYEGDIRAFAEEIRAKSLEYEGYKSELSGEQIKVDIFNGSVNAYGKRVDAMKTIVDARAIKQNADFKIAYDIPLQQLKQRTDVFVAKTGAAAERLKATNALNEVLQKLFQVRADIEKTRVTSENEIYKTEVEAVKNINDAKAEELRALNETNKNTVDIYEIDANVEATRQKSLTENNNSRVQTYKVTTDAKTAEIQGKTQVYSTDAQVHATVTKARETKVNAQVAIQEQELKRLVAEADTRIKAMQANVAQFLGQKDLMVNALKAIAQVQSQLAAAYGSAINYGGNIGYNHTESASRNANISYDGGSL